LNKGNPLISSYKAIALYVYNTQKVKIEIYYIIYIHCMNRLTFNSQSTANINMEAIFLLKDGIDTYIVNHNSNYQDAQICKINLQFCNKDES